MEAFLNQALGLANFSEKWENLEIVLSNWLDLISTRFVAQNYNRQLKVTRLRIHLDFC